MAQRGRPGQDRAKGLGVPTCLTPHHPSQQGFTAHLTMDSTRFPDRLAEGHGTQGRNCLPHQGFLALPVATMMAVMRSSPGAPTWPPHSLLTTRSDISTSAQTFPRRVVQALPGPCTIAPPPFTCSTPATLLLVAPP